MSDEQYRWLDRDAAERLLRGESLEAVDADTRDQADRLAEALGALGALTAEAPPTSAELPGEAAALAAFRKARTGRDGEQASASRHARTRSRASSSDEGLIHLGRSAAGRRSPLHWGRPVRYGLATALAVGMIGGIAVAASSGVLPFGGDEPEPAASVTSAVTPDRPLLSPSPDTPRNGGGDAPTPDDGAGGATGESSSSRDEARGSTGADPDARPGSDGARRGGRSGEGWPELASACRDHRDGKNLDSERRRSLEDAANGAGRVKQYCTGVLKNSDGRHSGDDRSGDDRSGQDGSGQDGTGKDGTGKDRSGDDRSGQDRSGKDGQGSDDEGGDSHPIRPGGLRGGSEGGKPRSGSGGGPTEPKTFAAARPPATPAPTRTRTPTPDVSALPQQPASSSPA